MADGDPIVTAAYQVLKTAAYAQSGAATSPVVSIVRGGTGENYINPARKTWRTFHIFVNDYEAEEKETGINATQATISDYTDYFTLSGIRVSSPNKGINIIRRSDGTARKLLGL